MAATLVALVGIILATAALRVPQGPTIQSAPLVLLDLRPAEVVIAVHGAFDQVRYARITVVVRSLTNLSVELAATRNDTYGGEVRVLRSEASAFDVNVTVHDLGGHAFRWRGAVIVDRDEGGDFMSVTAIEDLRSAKVYPPATFRTLIPELGDA